MGSAIIGAVDVVDDPHALIQQTRPVRGGVRVLEDHHVAGVAAAPKETRGRGILAHRLDHLQEGRPRRQHGVAQPIVVDVRVVVGDLQPEHVGQRRNDVVQAA